MGGPVYDSFTFPELLIVLWISLMFLADKLGKFSLSFKILLTFRIDAWVYNCLFLGLVFFFDFVLLFLKNFDFSLKGLDEIKEEIFTNSTCFSLIENLIFFWVCWHWFLVWILKQHFA